MVTQANDALLAERLTGGEVGASYSSFHKKLAAQGAVFWSEVTRPIANVTLDIQPDLIIRQRKNLGRTRSQDVELNVEGRLIVTVTLSGGYQFADATVRDFPANTELEGRLVPHLPRHAITFQARYANPLRLTAAVQRRFVGSEFDDDQNLLRLNRYFTLDAFVSRALGHGTELFAATENLFNQRYEVGRTPVRILGPPLLGRVGLRIEIPTGH